MAWVLMVALLLLQVCVHPIVGYGEPYSNGHPTYQERANHVFANAVRIAPSQYKSVYMAGYSPSPASILGSTYPAQPPLYMDPGLVASSSYHSNDMATNNCFSHPSCNGTDTFVRIKSFYTCSGTMGENIAAGYADPLDTNNQWLCDSTGSACAADGSGSDGHRSNIMSASYKAIGVGFAYNSAATYSNYWTQDFGGAVCNTPSNPVYSGSHSIKSGTISFIAVYYTTPAAAPSSATVVIAGVSQNLGLDIGSAGRATYKFSQTAGTSCRSYYFQFGSVRYPDTGCLVTYGEGSCTTSFDATCGGTNGAAATTTGKAVTTAAAATTAAAVTTAAATTAAATTGTATTGGSTYYLYTTSTQNSWVLQYNSGATVGSGTYSGSTCLRATLLGSSGNNFFWFAHNPAVVNNWGTVKFYAASASGSITILVYFNGGTYVTLTITTSWQVFSIPMSSLGSPTSVGTNQLVFQNAGTSTITIYTHDIAFV